MKQIFFLALALCLSTTMFAQIGVGIRAGATFSNVNFDAEGLDIQYDSRTGFVVGVPVEVRLPGPLGLQVELNYSQFGSKFEQDLGTLGNINVESVSNYLNIPVLLKVGKVGESFELSALAGPSFGYALTAKTISNDVEEDVEWTDEDVRSNIGFVLGAQGGLPVGPGKVTLDARYNLGLNDLDDQDEDVKITNRQFQVALGYMWTFGA